MARPEKPIDWDYVEKALIAGATQAKLAKSVGLHPDNLHDRFLKHYGMSFTDYAGMKSPYGEVVLQIKQFEKAMKGNTQMLIWLGKNRLDQRDGVDKNAPPPNDEVISKLIEEVKTLKDQINATKPKTDTVV